MEMCYEGALVMPSSYAVMKEEEMTYVEGGVSVSLTTKMLSKDYCKKIAKNYTKSTGLSQTRIAKEIFSHAVLYLGGCMAQILPLLDSIPMANQTISYILNHSNPVDLGGDAWYRVAAYNVIWYGTPSLV